MSTGTINGHQTTTGFRADQSLEAIRFDRIRKSVEQEAKLLAAPLFSFRLKGKPQRHLDLARAANGFVYNSQATRGRRRVKSRTKDREIVEE